MAADERARDARLLLLTWAAGAVDAVSYLGLGHVFTAMMTGNTVLLGLALGQGEVCAAVRSVLALAGFAAGVAAGALVVGRETGGPAWPAAVTRALAVEAGVLAAFAVLRAATGGGRADGVVHALIALAGVAMGLQAAAVRRLGVPGIATTYITGTLTSLVADLVALPAGPAAPPADGAARWERRVGLLAGVFVVYGLGALVGGVLEARWPTLATAGPLVAVALVVVHARAARARPGRHA